ncbi:hypothetical protein G9A89_012517 [Geosiphon pyriformis]|nr:hypothetical protein G9A89_012517 [Geosiphon pyriformis]
MKHTPFDFTYKRTATLPINFTVETYPVQPINEEIFQETLQKKAYTLLTQQKERHDNKLPPITNEFKIGNKDGSFYIHEILHNELYKLRLDDKILAKVAHEDKLKHYHSRNNPETLIPQIAPVANHLQNYHHYGKKTRSHSENRLPKLLKQNNGHTLIYKYFHIGKTLYERKLELEATNLTPKAIQKQIHNEFKTAARLTNTCYKFRTAFRLYNLFNTCENVLQNSILQPIKVQYIGKLTELKFQQFSD